MAVNISKTPKVNLIKGQAINLTKDGTKDSEKLSTVFFGAKWGSIIKKGFFGLSKSVESVDLDASLLMYDKDKKLIDTVYYGQRVSNDGAIKHSGDDLTGTKGDEQEDDNETISINLSKVNSKVTHIVAILNSFKHHKFDEIPYMKLRIYTGRLGNPEEVLCDYNLENNDSFRGKEAIVLGFFYRKDNGWKFRADGTTSNERSISEISRGTAIKVF